MLEKEEKICEIQVNGYNLFGGSHYQTLSLTRNMCHYHTHTHRHTECNLYTYVQPFTEDIAWSQIRGKQKTDQQTQNHSKTMVQFTEQRLYSVSDSSCCWESQGTATVKWELVGYWSWQTEEEEEEEEQ